MILPPFLAEGVLLGFLVVLTLFRRRLSSNDQYREMGLFDEDEDDGDEDEKPIVANAADSVGGTLSSSDGESPAPGAGAHTISATTSSVGGPKFANGLGLWKRPSFSRFVTFASEMEGLDYCSFVDATTAGTDAFFANTGSIGSPQVGRGRGHDKISRLHPDLLLLVTSYLPQQDLGPLSSVSRALAKDCKSDFIWRQRWIAAYGAMWRGDQIRILREKRGITWDPEGGETPAQGWFVFYLEWEACWLDWLLAGMCSSELCVIGLGGSVYNITEFLPNHPGSQETLAEACGGDGTERFADIGHSSDAVELVKKYLVCLMPEALTAGQYQEPSKINRHRGSRRGHATKFQSTMKREQQLAEKQEWRNNIHRSAAASAAALAGGLSPTETACSADDGASAPPTPLVDVGGFFDCPASKPHFGRARACYDPIAQQWRVWYTCCGRYVAEEDKT